MRLQTNFHSGKKLHSLLKQNGDFKALEVAVKKWHKKMFGLSKSGGWYTKFYLQNQMHWTKSWTYLWGQIVCPVSVRQRNTDLDVVTEEHDHSSMAVGQQHRQPPSERGSQGGRGQAYLERQLRDVGRDR